MVRSSKRRCLIALICASTTTAERIGIDLEVDGVMRRLAAESSENPQAVAETFCRTYGLSANIEGLPCSSTLTEELIVRGARHALPLEAALKLRAGSVEESVDAFAVENDLDVLRLKASVARYVVPEALGPGILFVPVDLGRSEVLPPTLSVDLVYHEEEDNNLSGNDIVVVAEGLPRGRFLAWPSPLEALVRVVPPHSKENEKARRIERAAAAYCVAKRCRHRAKTASAVARAVLGGTERPQRVVVSMSTLPGRVEKIAPRQLSFLLNQTRKPDEIYVVLPDRSRRQGLAYAVSPSLEEAADRGDLRLLFCGVDWGPATKLVPLLFVESEPLTLIMTVDDDLDYPPGLVAGLLAKATTNFDAAFGLRGYALPPRDSEENATDDANATLSSDDAAYYVHERLSYFDSADLESRDRKVHVLGGAFGVAYRSGFFDARRLADYDAWPGGAFFVDDDWISTALDEFQVDRFVIESFDASLALKYEPVVAPHHEVAALNAPTHAFRNIAFQAELLAAARNLGLFSDEGIMCPFLHEDKGALGHVLFLLERRFGLCNNGGQEKQRNSLVVIQAGIENARTLDAFLTHHDTGLQYVFRGVEGLSERSLLIAEDGLRFLWNFQETVDLLDLGSPSSNSSTHMLRHFAAALGAGIIKKGHTFLLTHVVTEDPILSFLRDVDCSVVTPPGPRAAWLC